LKSNWNVIFLHRSSSARPFRHRLDIEMSPEKFVIIQDEYKKSKDRLLEIQFNTLEDYFGSLEKYSKILENSIASRKMILLAAAVSDFTTASKCSKIDSSEGFSVIELDKVAKALPSVTFSWAPSVPVFSFKLETEEEKIEPKAIKYFDQGVKGVIGNVLDSRRWKVSLIMKNKATINMEIDPVNSVIEIEDLLVSRLISVL